MLTDQEKKFIMGVKIRLNTEGVPRTEWGKILQEQVTQFRIENKRRAKKSPSQNTGIRAVLQRIGNTVKRQIVKITMKRGGSANQPMDDSDLDRMMTMMENDPQGNASEMGGGLSGMGGMDGEPAFDDRDILPPIDSLGEHGTFLTGDTKKKTRVVDLDDD